MSFERRLRKLEDRLAAREDSPEAIRNAWLCFETCGWWPDGKAGRIARVMHETAMLFDASVPATEELLS